MQPLPPTGHGHGHAPVLTDRVARRVRLVVACVLLPLVLAATVVVVWLWPSGDGAVAAIQQVRATGTVASIAPCPMAPTECDVAIVLVSDGPGAGTEVQAQVARSSGVVAGPGDRVLMVHRPTRLVVYERYDVVDLDRTVPLLALGAAFAVAVVALSRWRGFAALGALAVCLGGLTGFILPAILGGAPPLLVAVSGGTLIMVIALFLTHGLTAATAVSAAGTVASLALTGVIGFVSLRLAGVSGVGSDNVGFVSGFLHGVDLQGLLLAGLVIGALGVLDDVTVTQATVVWELAAANPSASRATLFASGLRVGRAHVAATVNTLVLAYAGAALPLLMLFTATGVPATQVLSSAPVAEEVIRALAGSLGIIAAVPLTTALAALAVGSRPSSSDQDGDRGDRQVPVDEPAPVEP